MVPLTQKFPSKCSRRLTRDALKNEHADTLRKYKIRHLAISIRAIVSIFLEYE